MCSWAVKATGSHSIQVHFASADAVIPDWDDVEVVPHQDYGPDRGSVQAFDHPALDREIVGFGAGGWGELGFGTPGTDDVLVVNAMLGEDNRSDHDEATIAVAASLMNDLGWPVEG